MRYAHFTSSEKKMPPDQPSEGNEVDIASAEQSAMPKAEARDLAALNTDIWTPSEPVVHRPPPYSHLPPFPSNHLPPQVGSTIKHYELLRQLGEGAMGTVYLARDTTLGRLVAIKVLRIHTGPSAERFLIEAQATARCRHDNIVVIHEVDNIHGYPYMVLEYLEGRTLREWMAQRDRPAAPEPPLEAKRSPVLVSPSLAVELMLPVVRALSCAHQLGIVHRDLKPENIFLTDAGRVVVLDFGIAKRLDASELSEIHASARPPETSAGLTQKGALLGTLPYMSPEQLRSEDIDPRSDLWTVGIILYELVTGAHPRPRRSLLEIAQRGDSDEPMPDVRDRRPDVGALGAIIDRCLHKQRDERYRSAEELLAALEALAPDGKATELGEDERPFAGLFAFQETDAGKFFGRSHEIAEVVTQVRDRPLLAVAGSSGVGKSSFVRAGVIPALKRSGEPWETLILRPGRKPMEAIASMMQPVVAPASNLADDVEEHRKLVETLRREPGHLGHVLRLRTRRETRRLLLFVDQFEELYTQVSDPAERAAFTACLSAVADDATSPLRVVLAMRSDFLDRAAEDRRFIGALTKGLFFLGRPDRERLREAIENPAEMAGYRFELPSIVDDMLAHLEATPGALPLLQFTAAKLWDMRDRTCRLLTHASYTAMGGVAGALASHADRVMSDVGAEKVPLARAILLRLVTAERTRAIVPLAELRELSREDGDVSWLIDQMVDARLLVVQTLEGGKGTTVEIVHESLVHGWPTLRRWLDENQDEAALLDQLRTAARQWAAKNRDPGLLWRGDALAEYQLWRRRYAPSLLPLEAAFGGRERRRCGTGPPDPERDRGARGRDRGRVRDRADAREPHREPREARGRGPAPRLVLRARPPARPRRRQTRRARPARDRVPHGIDRPGHPALARGGRAPHPRPAAHPRGPHRQAVGRRVQPRRQVARHRELGSHRPDLGRRDRCPPHDRAERRSRHHGRVQPRLAARGERRPGSHRARVGRDRRARGHGAAGRYEHAKGRVQPRWGHAPDRRGARRGQALAGAERHAPRRAWGPHQYHRGDVL
jgi:serine/threonine protein kinase